MRRVIDLSNDRAKSFFLRESSYINFDLPIYFNFNILLMKIDEKLTGKKLSDFSTEKAYDSDGVNYHLFSNKDGKYSWRPFQLIHPALYVSLVHNITDQKHWATIKKRFREFYGNEKIECHSLPLVSNEKKKTDKEILINSWVQKIEQRSISLAIKYKYILHTDITDCYSSIYTHSISWAIHGKTVAKKKENRKNKLFIGVVIDQHLQDMNYAQTNGIPQGSTLMDFIAEIVLGYVDLKLSEKIKTLPIQDYHILRYRDDYRIFSNNSFEADQITKCLSEILSGLGLKLSAEKTIATDNIIKSAIKADKLYWIQYQRKTESKQKWLLQLYMLAEKFPNSGTLDTQMSRFLSYLKFSKRKDRNVKSLISITAEIAFRNPRVTPRAVAILSLLINQISDNDERKEILKDIKTKFSEVPNSSLLVIWLQRLFLKIDDDILYEELLCKKVLDKGVQIWNSDWLNNSLKKIMRNTPIVDKKKLELIDKVFSKYELKFIESSSIHYDR